MLTAVLQIGVALLSGAFAALALAVARRSAPPLSPRAPHAAWSLAGAAFGVMSLHSLATSSAAAWAVASGPGSAAWAAVVRWRPVGNYQRGFLVLGLGGALLLLAGGFWREPARRPWAAWAAGLLCLAGGTLAWALEPAPAPGREMLVITVVEGCMVVVMVAALLVAAARDTADRLLWAALAAFTVRSALDASLLAMAGALGPAAPAPLSPRAGLLLWAAVYAGMTGLAAWRLRAARRGTHVPALLEPLWPRRLPAVR